MTDAEYLNSSEATDVPDYSVIAERLKDENTLKILHACIGLATESGELLDAMKKHLFYGKPLDFVNLREEAGDELWYLAVLLRAIRTDFETTMDINISKLRARYPNKFEEHAALNRDLVKERGILEGVPSGDGNTYDSA